MDAEEFYRQAILVLTFLGGITFAGLVLILSSSSTFDPPASQNVFIFAFPNPSTYFDFLIGGFTFVSALCIIGSMVMLYLSLGDPELSFRLERVGRMIMMLCFVGFIYLLPFLLDRFNYILSIGFSIFDALMFRWFTHSGIRKRGLWKYPPIFKDSQTKEESDNHGTPPNDSKKEG